MAEIFPLEKGITCTITNGVGEASVPYIVRYAGDENAARAIAVLTSPVYFAGLARLNIDMESVGGGLWSAVARYGVPTADRPALDGSTPTAFPTVAPGPTDPPPPVAAPPDALPTLDGQGGADPSPPAPASPGENTPIGGEFSFTTTGGQAHYTQSLGTVHGKAVGGGEAPDFGGAIGLSKDGKVDGVDVYVPKFEFSVTRTLRFITLAYVRTLMRLTAKVNNAPFYGWADGEVLFLGVESMFKVPDGWSLTYKFAVEPNDDEQIVISGDPLADPSTALTVPGKEGWDYLWVYYKANVTDDGGDVAELPAYAYVERIYKKGDFSKLGIGV